MKLSQFSQCVGTPRFWLPSCAPCVIQAKWLGRSPSSTLSSLQTVPKTHVGNSFSMKNWPDRAYSYDPELRGLNPYLDTIHTDVTPYADRTPYALSNYTYPTGSMVTSNNFTYPERPGLAPRDNSFGYLGTILIYTVAGSFKGEVFPVEAAVGGLMTYLLLWSLPSHSQYCMPYDQMLEQIRPRPPQLFPQPDWYELFRPGYGFQLSTGIEYLDVSVVRARGTCAGVFTLAAAEEERHHSCLVDDPGVSLPRIGQPESGCYTP